MQSVLFVCTANRCRSPMAEALLKARVAQLGQTHEWQISSAGTWAQPNLPATALAQAVMKRRGLDLAAHRSRTIVAGLMQSPAVILVMTQDQRESLGIEFPEAAGRVRLLSQLVGQTFNIEDPVLGTEQDYELCAAEIDQILEAGFETLVELAGERRGE